MTTPQPPEQPPADGAPADDYVPVSPLLPEDPPRVGDFWLDARLAAAPAGVAFTAHDDTTHDDTTQHDTGHDGTGHGGTGHGGTGRPALVILLSEGAADDPAARDRLAGVVNAMHIDDVLARGGQGQDFGRLARKFRPDEHAPVSPDVRPVAPWVALAYDGSPAAAARAEQILDQVQLATLPQQGAAAGPDYHHYWVDRVRPGLTRLWPLPWPGRYDRAGWRTILVSWLLMMLLATLAVLIAILIFRNQPPQSPPPPTGNSGSPPPQSSSPSPQSGSPSPQSGSPSPQSGSPSPESGSPSPQSGSPSPSQSGSPTTGSASPTDSPSGGGSQDPSASPSENNSSPGSRL